MEKSLNTRAKPMGLLHASKQPYNRLALTLLTAGKDGWRVLARAAT